MAPMWAAIACASLATSFYGLVAVDSSNKRLLQSYPIALVLMLTLDIVWVVTWTAYIGENYTPVKGQWGIPAFRDAQKALLTCEWFALGTRVLSIPFWLKIFITAKVRTHVTSPRTTTNGRADTTYQHAQNTHQIKTSFHRTLPRHLVVAWSTKDLVAASLRLRANLSRKFFSLSSRLVIYSVKKKRKPFTRQK